VGIRDLKHRGIEAAGIHGDKSQNARQTALNRFRSGECRVLVATDIAARGIDVAGLSHVFNYDMPMEPEAYIHRIGRTGRAGKTGKAVSFCCIDEVKQLNQVEKLIGKRLREKQSDWPMEVTTPTPPKVRGPRPAKLTRTGEAAPARAPRTAPAARPAQPSRTPQQPAGSSRSSRPAQHRAASGHAASGHSNSRPRTGTGRPVLRVNRRKHHP
jgi:ATP-dependent RNA helicase RhlE